MTCSRVTKRVVRLGLGLMTMLIAAGMARPAFGQGGVQKILASDTTEGDRFGISLSVSGDVAIVSAHGNDDNTENSGSAYIFRKNGADWIEEAKLLASDNAIFDLFGWSVAVSGDVAVVGAMRDDDNGNDSGSAYIYRYDPNNSAWIEEAKLLAFDGANLDLFGWSVSISGDVVVVGARGNDDNGSDSGSAYIYRFDHDTSTWIDEAKLLASDGAANLNFGNSVSVSEDVVAVGTFRNPFTGSVIGSAYVFRYNGLSWFEESKLLASDGALGDKFGNSVSINGDRVVVSSILGDDQGEKHGSAYIFRYNGLNWMEETKLLAPDGTDVVQFGKSVAVRGDMVVVGAIGRDDSGLLLGAAYTFHSNPETSEWIEGDELLAPDGAVGDFFGDAVSVSDDAVFVGAWGDKDHGDFTGSAYVFEQNVVNCPADGNLDGIVNVIDLRALLAAWGSNPGHVADLTGPGNVPDGDVNVTDLLALLAAWGACP